jgi:hypothetical protein
LPDEALSSTYSSTERLGSSVDCSPVILGRLVRGCAEVRLYAVFSEVVAPASQLCYLAGKRFGAEQRVGEGEGMRGSLQTPAKVATWHTNICHVAYVLCSSTILQYS